MRCEVACKRRVKGADEPDCPTLSLKQNLQFRTDEPISTQGKTIYFLYLLISFQTHWADPQSPDIPDILLKPKLLVLFTTDLSKSDSRTYWH